MLTQRGKTRPSRRRWPEGKKFAFTIVDDTDHATTDRVRPVYDLLAGLGFRTTKTVWVFPAPEDPRWGDGETLEDPRYREFVLHLQRQGFEIALHNVRGTSSTRDMIRRGLERFAEVLGGPPRVHANHAQNLDNLYWGAARMPAWRRRLKLYRALADPSHGHEEGSPYFWGDLCRDQIRYVRGLGFASINTLHADPYMPYRDARYPFVNAWFSCSEGPDPVQLKALLSVENQQHLEAVGGLAIVYTHFGVRGFLDERGEVDGEIRDLLTIMSRRSGWFRPVGDILDFLAQDSLPVLRLHERLWMSIRRRLGS